MYPAGQEMIDALTSASSKRQNTRIPIYVLFMYINFCQMHIKLIYTYAFYKINMIHYHFQRYPRKCAIVAKSRIHEQLSPSRSVIPTAIPVPNCNNSNKVDIQDDWTEEESWVKEGTAHYFDQPTDMNEEHEIQHGYIESIDYIKQRLTQLSNTSNVDDKTELVTQIYQHLLMNPLILLYYPKFCNITYKKIHEIETSIRKQEEAFASTAILKSLQVFERDIHSAIHSCALLDRIELKLNDVRSLLLQYEAFLPRTELQKTFDLLKPIIKKIRSENVQRS